MQLSTQNLAKITKEYLNEIGSPHQVFDSFLAELRKLGPSALVGGAIRDWALGNPPRDLDLTVDCKPEDLKNFVEQFDYEENHFGGFKINLAGLKVDLWPLSKTWVFTHEVTWPITFENLLKTTFFNIDSIIYLIDSGTILEGGFLKAFEKKELDILYEANPMPSLCILKTILHQRKYGFSLSDSLKNFLDRWIVNKTNPITLRKLEATYKYMYKSATPPLKFQELIKLLPENLSKILL